MNVAIYSRKSKLTETGDSIRNQINMCKDYAKSHFGKCEYLIYEDEGFSGGNTDRPMFKKLIRDANERNFDVLICYRLDRLSRNVNDFSSTLAILEYNAIAFVSITEQFDTSTPLGKAMLSISSVFAQLERDTTAQRITDNFTELAKTGRYLTGCPPEGFVKKRITDSNGKYYNILEAVPDEIEKVKLIYQKYLEWESNTRLSSYCFQNGIKTKAGKTIKSDWITRILTHQLYAVADEYTYEYFKSIGAQIYASKDQFDGMHGITVFRRTKTCRGRHSEKNEPDGLIISVGGHEGIISSQDWISVQNIVNKRKHLGIRKAVGNYGVLNGLLRCKACGDYMRPVCVRNNTFHYVCVTKEKSCQKMCKMKNLKHIADTAVVAEIRELLVDKSEFLKRLTGHENEIGKAVQHDETRVQAFKKQISVNEKSISNLILQLSKSENAVLLSYITEQVEKLDSETKDLKKELFALEGRRQSTELERLNISSVRNAVDKLKSADFDNMTDTLSKRNVLKTIVKNIYWDGEKIEVVFFLG